jgi:hypothetical protein
LGLADAYFLVKFCLSLYLALPLSIAKIHRKEETNQEVCRKDEN